MKDRNNKLIAYCGIDCEKCDTYIATQHNDQELRERTAKLWSELNNTTILPEQLVCDGCRTEGRKTIFCNCLCSIRQCAMKRGKATCGDCDERNACKQVALIWENDIGAKELLH